MPGENTHEAVSASATTTWVVVTDGQRARILRLQEPADILREVEVIRQAGPEPEGVAAHRTDAPAPAANGPGAAERIDTGPEVEKFAQLLGSHLQQAHQRDRFDRLILIAPETMMPRLTDHLDSGLMSVLLAEIASDMMGCSAAEIRMHLPV
jgi:protein required for attachment to host cells